MFPWGGGEVVFMRVCCGKYGEVSNEAGAKRNGYLGFVCQCRVDIDVGWGPRVIWQGKPLSPVLTHEEWDREGVV